MYAENEILGNIKCLLKPGCLLSISLLTAGSTVVLKIKYFGQRTMNLLLRELVSNRRFETSKVVGP